MKRYIYVAAPYAKPDPVINTRAAILAADQLRNAGLIPYLPHTTMLWHMVCPHEPDYWYEYDLEWLALCHALLRLPGDSYGADEEVRKAGEWGIPVFFDIRNVIAWAKAIEDGN